MNIAAHSTDPRIQQLRVTKDRIIAELDDGRVISVPLAWSWRLSEATPAQRQNFRLIGSGRYVHWPDVDEDISAESLLHGTPAHRPRSSPTKVRNKRVNKRMPGTRVGDIAASADTKRS